MARPVPGPRQRSAHGPRASSMRGPRSRPYSRPSPGRTHRSDGDLKEGEGAAGERRPGPGAASRPGTHPAIRRARPFPYDVGGRPRCDDASAPWRGRPSWRSTRRGSRGPRAGPAVVRCPPSLQRATPPPRPRTPTPPPSGRAAAGVTPRPRRGATNAHQSGELDPCRRSLDRRSPAVGHHLGRGLARTDPGPASASPGVRPPATAASGPARPSPPSWAGSSAAASRAPPAPRRCPRR
jgi:hypothetical protein